MEDGGVSLIELMRTPARQSPTSLAGQLRYIRANWGGILGADLDALIRRLDLAIGILAEEERALHLRFGGGPGGGPTETPSFGGAAEEVEAFSSDSAWMPRVVLMAKSTYVWLDQLSRTYGRDIRTLDAIPDEELETLARWGVTGLWLIGLWERSKASERIKRMRGNTDAVASAYSLDDYAHRGGPRRRGRLRASCATAPGRTASGWRATWSPTTWASTRAGSSSTRSGSCRSPSRPTRPTRYTGADLSSDPRVGIVLEDHYWDDSDAAVVFKRFDRETGDERYVYHGNDGTSFPWNDTAQLDFLDPAVREQVIRVILDVARRFPIIRFDAAMVLAKKHIERLWWPEPGSGGGIPSRAEHAIPKAEFDRADAERVLARGGRPRRGRGPGHAPAGRGVLAARGLLRPDARHAPRLQQRVHAHAPRRGRRRLPQGHQGDHRVRPGDPQALRQLHEQPRREDRARAVRQGRQVLRRGDGPRHAARPADARPRPDPGLRREVRDGVPARDARRAARPVAGRAPRARDLPAPPSAGLVRRGQRLPAVRPRDAERDRSTSHVLAYSNGSGRERSLVIYHTRFASTSGRIRDSASLRRSRPPTGAKRQVRRSLAEGLGLPNEPGAFVIFRDARTGLEFIRSCRELWERRPRRLARRLRDATCSGSSARSGTASPASGRGSRRGSAGPGVASLEEALRELQLEPVHVPFRAIFADGLTVSVMDGVATKAQLRDLERRFAAFLRAIAEATGVDGDPAPIAAEFRDRAERAFVGMAVSEEDADFAAVAAALAAGVPLDPDDIELAPEGRHGLDRRDRAALLAWMALSHTGALAPGRRRRGDQPGLVRRAAAAVGAGRRPARHGLRRGRGVGRHRSGPRAPRAAPAVGDARLGRASRPRGCSTAWLALEMTRVAIGVNTWEGVEYIDRDRFRELLAWAVRLDTIDGGRGAPARLERADRGTAGRGRRVGRLSDRPAAGGARAVARRHGRAGRAARGRPAGRRPRARRARPRPGYPSRIRRRSEVGGDPWASTDSRCGR